MLPGLEAPAFVSGFDDVTMVGEAIEERRGVSQDNKLVNLSALGQVAEFTTQPFWK